MAGRRPLSVVVFSGGRGSSVLSKELITHRGLVLTLAINGYDDGMSTGEVRRFLGDALGPSDFRKNASHLARALRACDEGAIELLDRRLPSPCPRDEAIAILRAVLGAAGERVKRFVEEVQASAKPFDFSDCAIGNIVFAGAFLLNGRSFNKAVDDYCGLLNLPAGTIENVTDGTNAYLVALDPDNRLLASEADIVDANQKNRIKDIYLIDRRPTDDDRRALASMREEEILRWLDERRQRVAVNPRLVERLASADLIVYSPGTQHSSLFPSYLTDGLSAAIAGNLRALKLLITNIQADAELIGTSAVDIVDRAMYYMRGKGRLPISTPFLITHYLFNDPSRSADDAPYVPLGRLDSIEDPRLVRIGNYEDGVTGRHDPAKVLTPFLEAYLAEPRRPRVAVWLADSGSRSKVSQTLLEMVRAGIQDLALDLAVFYGGVEELDPTLTRGFPFPVRWLGVDAGSEWPFRELLAGGFDYALLFESSGMYNGEDMVNVAAPLAAGRLDAVWGSRRLSLRDIEASLRVRYRHTPGLRFASTIGSHLLSGAYLLLYGRYISDTLSGVRAVRASYLSRPDVRLDDKLLNQRLLSALLLERAEILETPVRFYAMSPAQVRRTSVADGIQALMRIVRWRLKGRRTAGRRTGNEGWGTRDGEQAWQKASGSAGNASPTEPLRSNRSSS